MPRNLRPRTSSRIDATLVLPFAALVCGALIAVAGWQGDWRAAGWSGLGCATLAVGAFGGLCLLLSRQVRRRVEVESLYRLLAENSSDAIVCVSPDGTRRYASPAFAAMTGWSEEELTGRDIGEIVHPDDRPGVLDDLARLRAGGRPSALRYRYLHRDGGSVWVETRIRAVPPARRGAPAELVGNVRDISRSKALEEELARANAELLELSSTDALTGLANRRRFDEILACEWDRAAREQLPLSLLVIDVDRFKAYNDRHGHGGGDACLRAVAAAVRGAARRPADLVARYGGEEFAVILPGTEAEGAQHLAEQVRAAVLALGLAHEDGVAGLVTVSVGVANTWPRPSARAQGLFESADRALYGAKQAGRNRVETSWGSQRHATDPAQDRAPRPAELPATLPESSICVPMEEVRMPSDPALSAKPTRDLMILDDMFLIRLALTAIAEEAGISVCEAEDSCSALETLARVDCRVLLADVNLGPNSAVKNGKDVAAEAMRLYPDLCVIYTSALPVNLGRPLLPRERLLQKPYPQEELVRLLRELLDDPALAPAGAVRQSQPT